MVKKLNAWEAASHAFLNQFIGVYPLELLHRGSSDRMAQFLLLEKEGIDSTDVVEAILKRVSRTFRSPVEEYADHHGRQYCVDFEPLFRLAIQHRWGESPVISVLKIVP